MGHKESDTTERLSLSLSSSYTEFNTELVLCYWKCDPHTQTCIITQPNSLLEMQSLRAHWGPVQSEFALELEFLLACMHKEVREVLAWRGFLQFYGNPFQYSCLENHINRGSRQEPFMWLQRVGQAWSDWICAHAPGLTVNIQGRVAVLNAILFTVGVLQHFTFNCQVTKSKTIPGWKSQSRLWKLEASWENPNQDSIPKSVHPFQQNNKFLWAPFLKWRMEL